jgi:hypothetical protein
MWLGYLILGSEARAAALVNLALLLPFIAVARQLTPNSTGALHEEPARV